MLVTGLTSRTFHSFPVEEKKREKMCVCVYLSKGNIYPPENDMSIDILIYILVVLIYSMTSVCISEHLKHLEELNENKEIVFA